MAKREVRFTHEWLSAKKAHVRESWYDSGCQNLIVRIGTGVRPSKVFYWYGRSGGHPTFVKIGPYPAVSVTEARDEAKRLTGLVAGGQSPVSRAISSKKEISLIKLFEWYMTNHAKPHKRTWREDQRNFEKRMIQWSTWKLSKITRDVVRKQHIAINEDNPGGPYAANKFLELLGFMWRLGREEESLHITAPDPTAGIKRFPKVERDRFLSRDEIPRFLAAVEKLPRETTRDLILLALLTGARRCNVCKMRWDEIDFSEATWRVDDSDSKNKRAMRIVLPEAAMEILRRRKKGSKSPWVLPGQGVTGHIVEPKHAIQAVMKEAGITNLRFHDLRRTLGSWQAAQGTSMIVIGKTLGHNSASSTRIYARLDLDPVRNAVEEATASMLGTKKKNKKSRK